MDSGMRRNFAVRLVEAMLDKGLRATRAAKSGVDVGPLATKAKVSREMARRYVEGQAIPDVEKMGLIANWLEVRLSWLRDGDGEKRETDRPGAGKLLAAREPGPPVYLSQEAIEVAQVWSKLPPERREWFRDLMSLEAVVSTHYPWLMFGRPRRESYGEYEKRIERDLLRLAAELRGEKLR